MNVAKISIFLLPKTSESEAAGRLTSMPGIVEAAAIYPLNQLAFLRLMRRGSALGLLTW